MRPEEGDEMGRAMARLLRARGLVRQRREDLKTVIRVVTRTAYAPDMAAVVFACEHEINGEAAGAE